MDKFFSVKKSVSTHQAKPNKYIADIAESFFSKKSVSTHQAKLNKISQVSTKNSISHKLDESLKQINQTTEKIRKDVFSLINDTISVINTCWDKIDISELILESKLHQDSIKSIKNIMEIIWLNETSIYVIKDKTIIKNTITDNQNELIVKEIKKIENINVKNIIKNEKLLITRNWFKYSNIWVPWKGEDFAIKINENLLISWDNYDESLDIQNHIELLSALAYILKSKYDKFIWEKDFLTWLVKREGFFNLIKIYDEGTIAILDIDHFKRINDTYWHDKWDDVLQKVSNILLTNLRKNDIVCRYWWEEFVIFLPNQTTEEAKEILERLREKIENTDFWIWKVTISWWFKPYHKNKNVEKCIKEADNLLYQAKNNGRNQIRW